ncbi:MAG: hypothetical protein ABI233_07770 [Chthoniobacterales bacterium]
MRFFAALFGIGAFALLASCAPLTPELPSGEDQQLDRPATLSGTPIPRNPLDEPDEATLPYVPGQ